MCGIVGYIGNKNAARILLNGLCVLCKKVKVLNIP